jgi:hypothetical protein
MQSFDKLTSDMARIYAIFKRAIGPQPLDEAGFSQEDGFVAIDTSNQYFSVRTDSNPEAECVITDDIDPKGIRCATSKCARITPEGQHKLKQRSNNCNL